MLFMIVGVIYDRAHHRDINGFEYPNGPDNDTYFGKVPPEYLRVEEQRLFFRGDGTRRNMGRPNHSRARALSARFT